MTHHVKDHQPPDQEQVRVRGLNWFTLSILTNLGGDAVPPRLGSESKPLLPAIGSSLFGAGDVQPKDERELRNRLWFLQPRLVGYGFGVWARQSRCVL